MDMAFFLGMGTLVAVTASSAVTLNLLADLAPSGILVKLNKKLLTGTVVKQQKLLRQAVMDVSAGNSQGMNLSFKTLDSLIVAHSEAFKKDFRFDDDKVATFVRISVRKEKRRWSSSTREETHTLAVSISDSLRKMLAAEATYRSEPTAETTTKLFGFLKSFHDWQDLKHGLDTDDLIRQWRLGRSILSANSYILSHEATCKKEDELERQARGAINVNEQPGFPKSLEIGAK